MLTIGCSNMNFPSLPTAYVALMSQRTLWQAANSAGYDNLEIHPLRRLFGRGIEDPDVVDHIGSLHQGFREERTLGEALRHTDPAAALQAWLMVPYPN